MNLLEMARLARLTYQHNAVINSDSGLTNLKIVEIEDYKYFIGESKDEIIISIRGSANFDNWITNLKFIPKKNIHRGFDAGKSLLIDSLAKIPNLIYNDKKIIIIGHSLAAALSVLVGDSLVLMGYNDIKVVGFESPRVVKKGKKLRIPFISTIIAGDIVTGLPSKRLGYKTVGTKIYFNNKGNLAKFNPFHLLKASYKGWFKKDYGLTESHAIDTVIKNIANNEKQLIKKGLWNF